MKQFLAMLEEIRVSLEAERAFGTMTFPFFVTKKAPVSEEESMMCYELTYEGEVSEGRQNFFLSVALMC